MHFFCESTNNWIWISNLISVEVAQLKFDANEFILYDQDEWIDYD